VTLRARWVTLRASWVTLRAHWVMLRARWVTLRARWVTLVSQVLGHYAFYYDCLMKPNARSVVTAMRKCKVR
jgi:hypothetical protein